MKTFNFYIVFVINMLFMIFPGTIIALLGYFYEMQKQLFVAGRKKFQNEFGD